MRHFVTGLVSCDSAPTVFTSLLFFKIQPSPIISIQFKRPKRGRGTDNTESSHRPTKVRKSLQPHENEAEVFLSD